MPQNLGFKSPCQVCVCVRAHVKRVMCLILHLGSMGCLQIDQTILSKVMTVTTISVMALYLCGGLMCTFTRDVSHLFAVS